VNDRFEPEFEGIGFEAGDGQSTLVGVVDQSHLYGLPSGLGDLGLKLLRVEAVPEKKKDKLRPSRHAETFRRKGQRRRTQKSKEKLNGKDLKVDSPWVVEGGRARQGFV